MVTWYKHDIPAWMDLTEGLGSAEYRVFHTVVQRIVLNDGPISIAEKSIAGCCNQSTRALRKSLTWLVDHGFLAITEGKISCPQMDVFLASPSREAISEQIRRLVFERDGFACVYCSEANLPLELDHTIPFSRGGGSTDKNLVTACRPCNRRKGARTPEEWLA